MHGVKAKVRLAVMKMPESQTAAPRGMVEDSGRALTTCARVGIAREKRLHAQGPLRTELHACAGPLGTELHACAGAAGD